MLSREASGAKQVQHDEQWMSASSTIVVPGLTRDRAFFRRDAARAASSRIKSGTTTIEKGLQSVPNGARPWW